MFVGRETSPPKNSAKFVKGTVTVEIGCGPDDSVQAVIQINHKKYTADESSAALANSEQRQVTDSEQVPTADEVEALSSDNESELAEKLIEMTFVEKKADRLIQEF